MKIELNKRFAFAWSKDNRKCKAHPTWSAWSLISDFTNSGAIRPLFPSIKVLRNILDWYNNIFFNGQSVLAWLWQNTHHLINRFNGEVLWKVTSSLPYKQKQNRYYLSIHFLKIDGINTSSRYHCNKLCIITDYVLELYNLPSWLLWVNFIDEFIGEKEFGWFIRAST